MKIFHLLVVVISLLLLSFAVTPVRAQLYATSALVVDNNGDTIDANPGDGICADVAGKCTLRAAIGEANANPALADAIIFKLPLPSVIDLTLGSLQITSDMSILGPGARKLTVRRSLSPGTPNFRVLSVSLSLVTIRGLTIANGNAGSEKGGGLSVTGAPSGTLATVSDIVFINNSAMSGGAISVEGKLYLNRALINSNNANNQGGAIITSAEATIRISNTTITKNMAPSAGAVFNAGNMVLVNDTITDNLAGAVASSTISAGPSINILNTIIGRDSISVPMIFGPFNSFGNNIITDARNSTGFSPGVLNDQVSDNDVIDPMFAPLGDYGGEMDTLALLPGSPAIDNGNNCIQTTNCGLPTPTNFSLFIEQRLRHRRMIGSKIDVGAFESGAFPVTGPVSLGGRLPQIHFNSMVVTTDISTSERIFAMIKTGGSFTVRNMVSGEVYVTEFKNKRAGNFPLLISRLDDF